MKMNWKWLAVLVILLAAVCVFAAGAEEEAFQPADLPVIYLHIDGGQAEVDKLNGSEDHSYRCTGTMDIVVPDGYDGQFEGRYPQENVEGLKIKYIRGRGNGTWNIDKNPYKIKLEDKADLFGMGKDKTWVLLANYFDNSLIRNWFVEYLAEQVGLEYTPQGVFVELVMEGEYLGNYFLCEQVQMNKHRVALDELTEGDSSLPEIQGGYLLEFCPDDQETPNWIETSRGQAFGTMSPSFDPEDGGYGNDAQKDYIREYIRKAEDAIYEGGDYGAYLDLQSLADYWWIMEFTGNEDAFRTDSTHMFKPRYEADGSEGKLHFGPVWDFDASTGNGQKETGVQKGFNNTTFIWVDELRKNPEFLEYLKQRWQVMDAKLAEMTADGGAIDRMAAVVQASWGRDDAKWHSFKEERDMLPSRNFEEEITHMKQWIDLRRGWINENLDRLGQLTYVLTVRGEGMEERTYDIACDTMVDVYMLDTPEVEGKTFTDWTDESGAVVDFIEMDADRTLTAQFE